MWVAGIGVDHKRAGLLLASSSIAALLIGGGGPAALAACYAGPFPFTNSTTRSCITVSSTSFTGNVVNTGKVQPGSPTGTGVLVTNTSTINGQISNAGTISVGGAGILIQSGSVVTDGISIGSTGTISVAGSGIVIDGSVSTFGGGIANTGSITAGTNRNGISVAAANFSGGITNSNAISVSGFSAGGISVQGGSTFAGGITNTGRISGGQEGIRVGFVTPSANILSVSTFAGSISNSGTISSGFAGIGVTGVQSFTGSISNGGTITGAANGIYLATDGAFGSTAVGGITNHGMIAAASSGIITVGVVSFQGGITNQGTITAGDAGIAIISDTNFQSGITNSNTITASIIGIKVLTVSTFAGNVSNSGGITAPTGIGILGSTIIGSVIDTGIVLATTHGIVIDSAASITSSATAVRVTGATLTGGISNNGTISAPAAVGIAVAGVTSFAGGVSNSGSISAKQTGIFVSNVSTFAGGIGNSGAITSASFNGIAVANASTGGIANTGTITAAKAGILVLNSPAFAGIVSNGGTLSGTGGIVVAGSTITGTILDSGTILATGHAIAVDRTSKIIGVTTAIKVTGPTLTGGISNGGTISAAGFINGILVGSKIGSSGGSVTVSTFAGGITNSGTIFAGTLTSASFNGIAVGGLVFHSGSSVTIETFSGGITNSGTISAFADGIMVGGQATKGSLTISTFLGGITNSGTITEFGNAAPAIFVGGPTGARFTLSTFAGGIVNQGTMVGGGITVENVQSFSGGITNSTAIIAPTTGIVVAKVSTFAGGITNTGSISGRIGILVAGSAPASIFDSGTIRGIAGPAVDLTGNSAGNTFTLGPPYSISGNVLGQGSDTFQLGGVGNGSFDLSTIGPTQQYRGFTTFSVVSGTWTANNAFAPTNPWTIAGGTLLVNGDLSSASSLTVTGGTLGGTGTVGNTIINSGGTFAPGAPGTPGTAMTVSGTLTFHPGTTYLVQLNPTTTTIANISGTASLAGNVLASFAAGSYTNRQYDILHSGALNGTTFASVATNSPNLHATLSYSATDVFLNLTASLPTQGLSANQQNVANALNNFVASGGTLPANFLTLFSLTRPNLANGLSDLTDEVGTGAAGSAYQLTGELLSLLTGPLDGGNGRASLSLAFAPDRPEPPDEIMNAYAKVLKAPPLRKLPLLPRYNVWAAGYGGGSVTSGDLNGLGSHDVNASTGAVAAGVDYLLSSDSIVGYALAGGGTSWGLASGLGHGDSDAFQAGLYGAHRFGPAYVSGALSFSSHWFTTSRAVRLNGADVFTASFFGDDFGARVEAGYRLTPSLPSRASGGESGWGPFGITPYAALQAQAFHADPYSEADLTGGGFGLNVSSMSSTNTRSELGARFDEITLMNGMPVTVRGRLAWAHNWVSNPALNAAFETVPGAGFTVNGAVPPADSLLTTVAADVELNRNWTLGAKFDGEFAGGGQTYVGTGKLRYAW